MYLQTYRSSENAVFTELHYFFGIMKVSKWPQCPYDDTECRIRKENRFRMLYIDDLVPGSSAAPD